MTLQVLYDIKADGVREQPLEEGISSTSAVTWLPTLRVVATFCSEKN